MWCYHTWDVLKLFHTEEITLWDSCWGNVSDFKFRRENPSPKQPVECASTCPQTNELGRCGDESARPMGSAGLKLRGCTRAGVWREAGDRRAQWPDHVLRDKQLPANHALLRASSQKSLFLTFEHVGVGFFYRGLGGNLFPYHADENGIGHATGRRLAVSCRHHIDICNHIGVAANGALWLAVTTWNRCFDANFPPVDPTGKTHKPLIYAKFFVGIVILIGFLQITCFDEGRSLIMTF